MDLTASPAPRPVGLPGAGDLSGRPGFGGTCGPDGDDGATIVRGADFGDLDDDGANLLGWLRDIRLNDDDAARSDFGAGPFDGFAPPGGAAARRGGAGTYDNDRAALRRAVVSGRVGPRGARLLLARFLRGELAPRSRRLIVGVGLVLLPVVGWCLLVGFGYGVGRLVAVAVSALV